VLFQAASGGAVFCGDSSAERIAAVLSHQLGELARRLPGMLGQVLDRATHSQVEQRHASAAELLFALRQAFDHPTSVQASGRLLLLPPTPPAAAPHLAWLGRALSNAMRAMLEGQSDLELIPERLWGCHPDDSRQAIEQARKTWELGL